MERGEAGELCDEGDERAREGGVVRREGGVRAREARDALLELVDERGLVGEGGGGEAFDHWG